MSNPESNPKESSDTREKPCNHGASFATFSMLPQEGIPVDYDSQWQPSKPSAPKQAPIYSTPAPTTSDIHNAEHEHNEPDSEAEDYPQTHNLSSPMLKRFMTVNPDDSSLKYEALIAISEGRVQVGEDMLERRRREIEEFGQVTGKK
jgi:hypothetical protein